MKFIVHVVDFASTFSSGIETVTDINTLKRERLEDDCEIMVSDGFYTVSAENEVEAVYKIASVIRVKEGEIVKTLAEGFLDTQEKVKVSPTNNPDFPDGYVNSLLCNLGYVPYGKHMSATYQRELEDENGPYTEAHNVSFFVVNEEKIIEIA